MAPRLPTGGRRYRQLVSPLAATLCGCLLLMVVVATSAGAHTGFDSSEPADGASVESPVREITLVFSGQVEPIGEGFVVLDPAGVVRPPDGTTSTDNKTWVLVFDDPLVGGDVGVRWTVRAPDSHTIDGSFSFTVAAPPPTTTTSTTAAPTTTTSAVTTTSTEAVRATTEAPASSVPQSVVTLPSTTTPPTVAATAAESPSMADFLNNRGPKAPFAAIVGALGRLGGLVGAALAVGGLVFAAGVLRGAKGEVLSVLRMVRFAGLPLVFGSILSATSQVAEVAGAWSSVTSAGAIGDALAGNPGISHALRLIGGVLVAAGVTPLLRSEDEEVARKASDDLEHVWVPSKSAPAFAGAICIWLSFLFDGHTVSEGSRWLHSIVNLVHVGAGLVWAGGLVMLAVVVRRRRSVAVASGSTLALAVRFSVIAAAAVVAAGLGGTVLSVIIVDRVSDLWSTPWGRLLLAKIAVVAVAAASGAYNRFVLIPAMRAEPNHQAPGDRFRSAVTIEALAFVVVLAITAFLVAAQV